MRIKMEHNTLLESYKNIVTKFLYKNIVTKFLDKIEDEQFQDLVTRGLVISKNKAKQPILLLSGINPSFNDKENDRQDVLFTFAEAKDHGRSKYWGKKHNQFGGKYSKLVQEDMAYLDLFPLKETKQLRFERVLRPYNDFRMELLVETQKEIEKINPKLIVHANKTSLYYWGLNPITYTKDSVNTWMNYDFEEINFRDCPPLIKYSQRVDTFNVPKEKRFVHFYKISGNGFVDGNHYFLAYVMEYYGMKDWQKVQLLTPIEMTELWEWCKKNS